MRKNGRPKPESGPAGDLRPVEPESPILKYRLADIPDIFSLYLDAVEVALRNSLESANGAPPPTGAAASDQESR